MSVAICILVNLWRGPRRRRASFRRTLLLVVVGLLRGASPAAGAAGDLDQGFDIDGFATIFSPRGCHIARWERVGSTLLWTTLVR